MKDSIVPFVISCVAYLVMGWLQSASGSAAAGAGELFSREFRMGLIPLIPAAAIFILAICKVEVKNGYGSEYFSGICDLSGLPASSSYGNFILYGIWLCFRGCPDQ